MLHNDFRQRCWVNGIDRLKVPPRVVAPEADVDESPKDW